MELERGPTAEGEVKLEIGLAPKVVAERSGAVHRRGPGLLGSGRPSALQHGLSKDPFPAVTPGQLFGAIIDLGPQAFQAEAQAVLALAAKHGDLQDGELRFISGPVHDRRLHGLLNRAVFDLANGVPPEELPTLLHRVQCSMLRGVPGVSLPLPVLARQLDPPTKALAAQALAKLTGQSVERAAKHLDSSPGDDTTVVASVSLEALAGGMERARHCLVMKILADQVDASYSQRARDPFVRLVHDALVKQGHSRPPPHDPRGTSAILAAMNTVFRDHYADRDGQVLFSGLTGPGPEVGTYGANSLAVPLWWEAAARRAEVAPATLAAEQALQKQIAKLATILSRAKKIPVEQARHHVIARLNQVNRADLFRGPRLDDAVGGIDPATGRMCGLAEALLPEIQRFNDDYDAIPKKLEMLERTKARLDDHTFQDHLVLTVQHQVGVLVPFLEALVEKGARAEDMVNIGVPYSANAQVELKLGTLGMDNRVPGSLAELKPTIERAMEELIAKAKQTGKPILVIDDGGTVMDLISTKFKADAGLFRIVEQTMRGITATKQAIARGGFKPPTVVAAATSEAKFVADQHIAETALRAIRTIVAARDRLLPDKVAPTLAQASPAVMGFGTISGSLARNFALEIQQPTETLLEARARVGVWDIDPLQRQLAREEGFFVPERREDLFKGRDVLVGATGFPSITLDDLPLLAPHCLTMSMSSKQVEFEEGLEAAVINSGWDPQPDSALRGWSILGSYAPRAAFGLAEQLDRPSEHLLVEARVKTGPGVVEGGPILVNRLQPINFDHTLFCVPEERAQLIRAILLDAAAQAVQSPTDGPGVPVDYDPERQRLLLADWQAVDAELRQRSR